MMWAHESENTERQRVGADEDSLVRHETPAQVPSAHQLWIAEYRISARTYMYEFDAAPSGPVLYLYPTDSPEFTARLSEGSSCRLRTISVSYTHLTLPTNREV